MPGYHDLDPLTREGLVGEYLEAHRNLSLVRPLDPDDPLPPLFQDRETGGLYDLAGNRLDTANGGARPDELSITIDKAPIPIWLILFVIAGLLLLKKGKL